MVFLYICLIILIYFILEIVYRDFFKYKTGANFRAAEFHNIVEYSKNKIKDFSKIKAKEFKCDRCKNTFHIMDCVGLQNAGYEKEGNPVPFPCKFLKLSCKKCGFSHFYDLNILFFPEFVIDNHLPKSGEMISPFKRTHCLQCNSESTLERTLLSKRSGMQIFSHPRLLISRACRVCGRAYFFDLTYLEEHLAAEKHFHTHEREKTRE
jgi:hypothetical protein